MLKIWREFPNYVLELSCCSSIHTFPLLPILLLHSTRWSFDWLFPNFWVVSFCDFLFVTGAEIVNKVFYLYYGLCWFEAYISFIRKLLDYYFILHSRTFLIVKVVMYYVCSVIKIKRKLYSFRCHNCVFVRLLSWVLYLDCQHMIICFCNGGKEIYWRVNIHFGPWMCGVRSL